MKLFIPFSKVDAANRLVYGIATAEKPDRSGEICDYESTKPYYAAWSGEFQKVTDGQSLGNLRAMHNNIAAGKVTQIAFNDAEKQIEICAKVVDDNEWRKVEEGVYTGFSQGGSYVKRWTDPSDPTKKRYTAQPTEISLVDLPCLPDATLQFVKADGAVELRKVAKTSPDAVIGVIEGDPPTEITQTGASATDPREEVEQVWLAKDGSTHKKKADAVARNIQIDAEAAAKPAVDAVEAALEGASKALEKVQNAAAGGENAPETQTESAKLPEKSSESAQTTSGSAKKGPFLKTLRAENSTLAKAEGGEAAQLPAVRKSLYSISDVVCALRTLKYVQSDLSWEADMGDEGAAALMEKTSEALKIVAELLRDIVNEETAELVKKVKVELLQKVANYTHVEAFNGREDAEKVDLELKIPEDLSKALSSIVKPEPISGDLAKVVAENNELKKGLTKAVEGINALTKRLEVLEAQPAPAKGVTMAVTKGQDGGGSTDGLSGDPVEVIAKVFEGKSEQEKSMILMKAALRNGKVLAV